MSVMLRGSRPTASQAAAIRARRAPSAVTSSARRRSSPPAALGSIRPWGWPPTSGSPARPVRRRRRTGRAGLPEVGGQPHGRMDPKAAGGDDRRRAELVTALGALRARIAAACEAVGRDPRSITLIAVTKTYPAADVATPASLGVLDIGENRDQEARAKIAELAEP